jgi:hypothetical protein
MRKGKVKVNLEIVLEDGSKGEWECPVTLCGTCHNMQLFPDIYRKDKFSEVLIE